MKGDDWQKGMDNETRSVNDPGWSAETRRALQRLRGAEFARGFVVASVGLGVLSLGISAYTLALTRGLTPLPPVMYGGLSSLAAFGIAVLLGWWRFQPAGVGTAFALFPALHWVLTSLITVPVSLDSFGLASVDGVPTGPLSQEFTAVGLMTLVARAATGYVGVQFGRQKRLRRAAAGKVAQ